jgi:hypothetical protein
VPNWAVVIGVDRYAAAHLNLKGAVRDALGMAEFLAGGATPLVMPSRLTLLLTPTPNSPRPSALLSAVSIGEATRRTINEAIREVARKQPDGGRLFVNFSGHGLVGPGLNGGDAILPSDYQPDDPGISISLEGIRDFLRTSLFNEQFFFIDACRNTPMPENFNIGQFPVTPPPEQMRPAVQQFVFCATLRGVTAHEDRRIPNDERGVFSEPLLRGLRGEKQAKTFDEKQQAYLVTVSRLLSFLRREMEKTIEALQLPRLPDGTRPQEPRLLGDMASVETIIVPMAPTAVPPVALTFTIVPPEASSSTTLVVRRDTDIRSGPPILDTTIIPLPPRDYRVVATADGFRPLKPSWPIEPYEDTRLTIEFEREQPEIAFDRAGSLIALPSSIEFLSSDPLTIVRLIGGQGQVLATGRERIVVPDLTDGSYVGQVILPDGRVIEKVVEVDEGAHERVLTEVPSPSERGIIAAVLAKAMDQDRRPITITLDEEVVVLGDQVTRGTGRVFVSLPVLRGWFTRLEVARVSGLPPSASVLFERPQGLKMNKARRLLAAQRYYQSGLFEAAIELAREDLDNPIGALIDAYSWLRVTFMARGGARLPQPVSFYETELHLRANRLSALCPDLSDAALLQSELALISQNTDAAIGGIRAALDMGLPLLAFGTQRLTAHLRVLQIDHPLRAILEQSVSRKIPGWILTAWRDSH